MCAEHHGPLLILGMHRSGTSAVARVLEGLGLFIGARQDPNAESVFFLELNRWLFLQAGATWDRPEPVADLLRHPELAEIAVDRLRFALRSPRSVIYLGLRRYLACRDVTRLDCPWGWKDPRNTFTLPFWLRLFPDARVLHVRRHGVDVAASLRAREEDYLRRTRGLWRHRRFLYAFLGKPRGFVDSVRATTLEGAFSLWETYVLEAGRVVRELGARALELRYEDLVRRPRETLHRAARFAGLEPPAEAIEKVCRRLRPERAHAFERDPALRRFAGEVAERLAATEQLEKTEPV